MSITQTHNAHQIAIFYTQSSKISQNYLQNCKTKKNTKIHAVQESQLYTYIVI